MPHLRTNWRVASIWTPQITSCLMRWKIFLCLILMRLTKKNVHTWYLDLKKSTFLSEPDLRHDQCGVGREESIAEAVFRRWAWHGKNVLYFSEHLGSFLRVDEMGQLNIMENFQEKTVVKNGKKVQMTFCMKLHLLFDLMHAESSDQCSNLNICRKLPKILQIQI